MANQPFTTWGFAATDAPTARTLPDRLSEIINVKDWGATGDGTTDDLAAVQAAIDYAIDQGGGVVFFPSGIYAVSSPLTFGSDTDANVTLRGTSKNTTNISRRSGYSDPSAYGYVICKGNPALTYDCLARIEGIGQFNVKATRSGFSIEECLVVHSDTVGAKIACNVSEAVGSFLRNCSASGANTHLMPDDPDPGPYRGSQPDTICFALGAASVAMACNVIGGYEIAYAHSGDGGAILGCRGENLGVAVRIGWGPDGETASYGCTVQGMQTERCQVGIELYNATGAFISSNFVSSTIGMPVPEACSLSWSGGTATVTITGGAHNVPDVGTHIIQFGSVASAWIPGGASNSCVTVEVASSTTFTYPLTPDPGGADAVGTWGWPSDYNLRCRKVYETVIIGNSFNANCPKGDIDLDWDGEAEARNNVIAGVRTSYGWVMPSDPGNLAGWTFAGGVGGGAAINFPDSTNPIQPRGTMVFADLPGQSGVLQDGPYEGQEYDIIDGNSSAFDATQAGGGSGHYKVRYNGSVWKRIG